MKNFVMLVLSGAVLTVAALASPDAGLNNAFSASTFAQTWQAPLGEWQVVADTFSDPGDDSRLASEPGEGVAVNGATGKTEHLITRQEFGDVELSIDFMVPQGSNSGVYLQGRYEIQVLDSFGVEHPTHGDCGGIYQRWNDSAGLEEDERGYEGHAPLVNASKKPGDWQNLRIIFRAPRFDADGTKTENARFEKVWLNGTLIHDGVELTGPTRAARFSDERPQGPLMLQGDHGPVAYRDLEVKRLP